MTQNWLEIIATYWKRIF